MGALNPSLCSVLVSSFFFCEDNCQVELIMTNSCEEIAQRS